MSVDDFLQVEGFKITMATKIYNGIREKLKNSSIVTFMSASNIFGRGFSEKKLEIIMNEYPDILLFNESENKSQLIYKIASIKGIAEKTAEAFV